jgi:hypothetical protein
MIIRDSATVRFNFEFEIAPDIAGRAVTRLG